MAGVIDPEMRDGMLALASKMHRIQEQVLLEGNVDITYRNFRGLQRIANGSNTLTKLGTFATITYSALSQSIASLIAKGYVSRRPGVDRREAVLAITPSGITAMEAAAAYMDEFVGRLAAGLPDSDIKYFRRILFHLLDNLDVIAVERGLRPAERARRQQGDAASKLSID